ncbi:MAG: tetratricopeptide repeat protein [Armatimonadota bacterium]
MSRFLPLCLGIILIAPVIAIAQEDADLEIRTGHSFADIALLPTRLTAYNAHDDSSKATYVCCRPDQEEQIALALKANDAFLNVHAGSDFADDTLMFNTRIDAVRKNFRHSVESQLQLLERYPESDLADDAAWGLASRFREDQDHAAAIQTLQWLVDHFPFSTWSDDALALIAAEMRKIRDEQGALAALQVLAQRYPHSEHCASAHYEIAAKYQELGNFEAAVEGYMMLIRRYPCSDYVDDAQFKIGQCFRAMRRPMEAVQAYEFLINRMPGSQHVPSAMREANTLYVQNSRRGGGDARQGPYNLQAPNSKEAADELYAVAHSRQNYRRYREAVGGYRTFVQRFPGHDKYDDALYNIGVCYQELNLLFGRINQAQGPDDLFKLSPEWRDATGALQGIPTDRELKAVDDAVGAFALVANNLIGSPLRDDAIYQIAKSYEDVGQADDEAFTYQQLLINFPGSEYETEALYRLLKYYRDPANYETASQMYKSLSKAVPDVFPPILAEDKADFLHVMGLYFEHVNHGWEEYHLHHIPYRVTMPDLVPEASYYSAAIMLKRGDPAKARKLLAQPASLVTNDFGTPALYLLGAAAKLSGDIETAEKAYQEVCDRAPLSGLADDAQLALMTLDQEEATEAVAACAQRLGIDPSTCDVHEGDSVVVFAPYTVAAKMRMYNLPNIWDAAVGKLVDWTGESDAHKLPIVVTDGFGPAPGGAAIRLVARQVGDPPQWQAAFRQMANRSVAQAGCTVFQKDLPAVTQGMAALGAAGLEFSLVSETRETLGSAAPTILPHDALVKARNAALDALDEYERGASTVKDLNQQIVLGMLLRLLEHHGYAQHEGSLDWEPFRRFFDAVRGLPADRPPADQVDAANAFVHCVNVTFGTDNSEWFRRWGFPVDPRRLRELSRWAMTG